MILKGNIVLYNFSDSRGVCVVHIHTYVWNVKLENYGLPDKIEAKVDALHLYAQQFRENNKLETE